MEILQAFLSHYHPKDWRESPRRQMDILQRDLLKRYSC